MRSVLAAGALALLNTAVQAQGVNGFQSLSQVPDGSFSFYSGATPATNAYIVTLRGGPVGDTAFVGDGLSNRQPVSLDQFASTQQLQDVRARQDQFAFFAQRDFDRLSQGIALASALTIMPPNPGDRFALTVSGAGFDGRGAGAISGTYRVREDILVFGGYARSETQNLVKGGATFSFR